MYNCTRKRLFVIDKINVQELGEAEMKGKTFSLLNVKANETYLFDNAGRVKYTRHYITPLVCYDSGGMKDRELIKPLLKSKVSVALSISKCVDKNINLK